MVVLAAFDISQESELAAAMKVIADAGAHVAHPVQLVQYSELFSGIADADDVDPLIGKTEKAECAIVNVSQRMNSLD